MIVIEREWVARMVRERKAEHDTENSEYDDGYVAAMSLVEAVLALAPAYDLGRLPVMKGEGT